MLSSLLKVSWSSLFDVFKILEKNKGSLNSPSSSTSKQYSSLLASLVVLSTLAKPPIFLEETIINLPLKIPEPNSLNLELPPVFLTLNLKPLSPILATVLVLNLGIAVFVLGRELVVCPMPNRTFNSDKIKTKGFILINYPTNYLFFIEFSKKPSVFLSNYMFIS